MTTIITKKGKGAPASDNLDVAELALDVETGSLYTKLEDLSVHEISASSGSGGTGSSVHIGENPPADPQEGQQWMEVPADGDATMWIYDGEKWLEQPGGGSADGDLSSAVLLTGDQEIDGVKTFNEDIIGKANVYGYFGSDERLKDDIAPMPIGLIDDVNPCVWKWKSDGQSFGGVIAQQLQKIGLDDWVREAPSGDLGVDSMALIGMLIAEVQDLKRRMSDGDR